ncbi:transcriptional regulator [Klebsiella michiganensis]|uniref:Transcriptional regulator n=1 Tax=Klebsiella michiganensis TaxID=1134687 RepID=A0A7H4PE01_9ENTR|nr:transcriptional regulator [Klebsiella michiganensis]
MVNTPGLHGAKLPATRELARLLGVSRNTVVSVYERLYADDLIETRQGRRHLYTLSRAGG